MKTNSVVANLLDLDIAVSSLSTDTFRKYMNSLILPAMGPIIPLLSFYKNGFSIKLPVKVDMPLNKEPNPIYRMSITIKFFLFFQPLCTNRMLHKFNF